MHSRTLGKASSKKQMGKCFTFDTSSINGKCSTLWRPRKTKNLLVFLQDGTLLKNIKQSVLNPGAHCLVKWDQDKFVNLRWSPACLAWTWPGECIVLTGKSESVICGFMSTKVLGKWPCGYIKILAAKKTPYLQRLGRRGRFHHYTDPKHTAKINQELPKKKKGKTTN